MFFTIRILHYNDFVHIMKKNRLSQENLKSNNMKINRDM